MWLIAEKNIMFLVCSLMFKKLLKNISIVLKNMFNKLLGVHIMYDNNAIYSHVKQKVFHQDISRYHAMIIAAVLLLQP